MRKRESHPNTKKWGLVEGGNRRGGGVIKKGMVRNEKCLGGSLQFAKCQKDNVSHWGETERGTFTQEGLLFISGRRRPKITSGGEYPRAKSKGTPSLVGKALPRGKKLANVEIQKEKGLTIPRKS